MGMKVNGSTGLTFPDSTTMVTGAQAVKAWVNFNGTGTVAIRASYNVTSITDNGTGDYTVNFTTAFQDANYSWATSAASANTGTGTTISPWAQVPTTTTFRFATFNGGQSAYQDASYASVQIFR